VNGELQFGVLRGEGRLGLEELGMGQGGNERRPFVLRNSFTQHQH
jgi:hypothetical protein